MRRRNLLMCVGWLAATVAAPWLCAQSSGGQSRENKTPVADQFVSTPGRMVSTPGRMVTGPGQMVTTPGQMVTSPGVMVVAPGQSISPVPGVIAPFHTQTQQSSGQTQAPQSGGQGVTPGRQHHNRHEYRPEYGVAEGYALPYMVSGDYGAAPSAGSESASSAASNGRSMMGVSGQTGSGLQQQAEALADAPSGNRPPYRGETEAQPEAPSTAPNVIQSREPVLMIVMKDGSKRKVRNYALTPQMLIDLDSAASGTEVRIPLSEINVAATQKAAAQAGLSFAVPTS